jgi:ATP-dependent DNA helicase DinG
VRVENGLINRSVYKYGTDRVLGPTDLAIEERLAPKVIQTILCHNLNFQLQSDVIFVLLFKLTTMNEITVLDYFPLPNVRQPQESALKFIQEAVQAGCDDIVVEAPTGTGKSAIGAACCWWAQQWPDTPVSDANFAKPGGYYLVTQKELQNQIVKDVRLNYRIKDFASLKSASDTETYQCDQHPSCQIGLGAKNKVCEGRRNKCCPYKIAQEAFIRSTLSLTNYPYFLTERLYVGKLPPRNIIVCDECHTLERNLLKFGELVLSERVMKEWDIRGLQLPEFDEVDEYIKWLELRYLPIIKDRYETLITAMEMDDATSANPTTARRAHEMGTQLQQLQGTIASVRSRPDDWVYWPEETEKDGIKVNLKPLDAAPYASLIRAAGVVKIYMSAWPGPKDVFCRNLGLKEDKVAWLRIPQGFPPENRPIMMGLVGSMSKRNITETMPAFLRVVDKILTKHGNQKGLIHCNSYDLGTKLTNHFQSTAHAKRLLYPKNADERSPLYKQHLDSPEPTVLISPSMTEGFDFKDDAARWQIIAKMPYPYLGDLQISTKKELDPDWYAMQTAMAIIQACGRIVRSETDTGVTYILDSDFRLLWDRYERFFPGWFRKAIVWGQK